MNNKFYYFLRDKTTGMYHLQNTMSGGNSSLCGKKNLKTVRCTLSGQKFIDDNDDVAYQVVRNNKNRRTKREVRLLVAALQSNLTLLPSFFEDDESFENIDSFEKSTADKPVELTDAEKALKLFSPGICGQCVAQLYDTLENE